MQVIGKEEALKLGCRAGRLIGLQYYQETRKIVGADDGDLYSAVEYLQRMFAGMGDTVKINAAEDQSQYLILHSNLRILRDLEAEERDIVLSCWQEIWQGAMSSCRQLKQLQWDVDGDQVNWTVSNLTRR